MRRAETLFVERKESDPKDGLGPTVASFANMLGGWLLVGVDNDGNVVAFAPPGTADLHDYIRDLLRSQVDPLPPFAALSVPVAGQAIGVVRIAVAAWTPGRGGPPGRAQGRRGTNLRGILHCARCGGTLYTRRYAAGRHYLCRSVYDSRGTCDLPRLPADAIEGQVLRHLDGFNLDLQEWLAARGAEQRSERDAFAEQLARQGKEVAKLARRAQRAHDQHRRLLDAGDELADAALRSAAGLDADHADAARALAAGEEKLANWHDGPQINAALDAYNSIAALIGGRIRQAESAEDLRLALRDLLERCDVDVLQQHAYVRFELSPGHFIGLGVDLEAPAPMLAPPIKLDGRAEKMRDVWAALKASDPPGPGETPDKHGVETGPQTLVGSPDSPR